MPPENDPSVSSNGLEAAATETIPVIVARPEGPPSPPRRSEKPLSREDLEAQGISLNSRFLTPAAHRFLTSMPREGRITSALKAEALNRGRQLTLEEARALIEITRDETPTPAAQTDDTAPQAEEPETDDAAAPEEGANESEHDAVPAHKPDLRELLDVKPDTVPQNSQFTCEISTCGIPVTPKIENIVVRGEVLRHRGGPYSGQTIRTGNFMVREESGIFVAKCLCTSHKRAVYEAARSEGRKIPFYPFNDATAMTGRLNKERKEILSFASSGSPAGHNPRRR